MNMICDIFQVLF